MIFALKKEKKYNFRNTFFRYDRVITRLQPASMVFKNIFFISGSKIQKYSIFVAKNTYVKQQQSKPLIESLENRVFSEFQPDALASFCRSWYEYTAALVAFFPCLVIFSISQLKFLFYNFWYFAIFLFTFIDDFSCATIYCELSQPLNTESRICNCKLDLIHITITVLCSKWCYTYANFMMQNAWVGQNGH